MTHLSGMPDLDMVSEERRSNAFQWKAEANKYIKDVAKILEYNDEDGFDLWGEWAYFMKHEAVSNIRDLFSHDDLDYLFTDINKASGEADVVQEMLNKYLYPRIVECLQNAEKCLKGEM